MDAFDWCISLVLLPHKERCVLYMDGLSEFAIIGGRPAAIARSEQTTGITTVAAASIASRRCLWVPSRTYNAPLTDRFVLDRYTATVAESTDSTDAIYTERWICYIRFHIEERAERRADQTHCWAIDQWNEFSFIAVFCPSTHAI